MNTNDLNKEPKIETGFKIPENYFEHFEAKMLKQLPKKETKVVQLWKTNKVWFSSAAAVLVLALLVPFYLQINTTKPLETTTLESYLSTEISTYELTDKLTDDDILELEQSLSLNNEALEEYLLDTQNIDYYLNN